MLQANDLSRLQQLINEVSHEFERIAHKATNEPSGEAKPFLSVAEVAKLLSVSKSTVHNWKRPGGKLSGTYQKVGGRVYFSTEAVYRCLEPD